jgi:hypothetical protein
MSGVGRGRGTLLAEAIPGDPTTDADDADLGLSLKVTDVLCANGAVVGCSGTLSDYGGQLLLSMDFRLTDRANPFPDVAGTTGDSLSPYSFLAEPIGCTPTPGPAGSTCTLSTSADSILPGFVGEGRRGVLSLLSIEVFDAGPDGDLIPFSESSCPPYCGTGDESMFLTQGIFTP